jgi:hypothetical protein
MVHGRWLKILIPENDDDDDDEKIPFEILLNLLYVDVGQNCIFY